MHYTPSDSSAGRGKVTHVGQAPHPESDPFPAGTRVAWNDGEGEWPGTITAHRPGGKIIKLDSGGAFLVPVCQLQVLPRGVGGIPAMTARLQTRPTSKVGTQAEKLLDYELSGRHYGVWLNLGSVCWQFEFRVWRLSWGFTWWRSYER